MGKTRSWSVVAAALAALVLSACGGGAQLGDDSGGSLGGTTGGTTEPQVATLQLFASSPQLSSDASSVDSGVTLTAIAKDSNNNVVSDVTVVFSTPDSAEINVANPVTTDANGRATAVLTTGGDAQNRTINVTASAEGRSSTVSVQVIGTTLSISGVDSTQIGVSTEYTVLLADAAGAGIAGKTITASTDPGNTLSAETLVTNAAGQVTLELSATEASSFITVSALGLTATKNIVVSTDQFTITTPSENSEVNIGAARTVTAKWLQSGSPVPDGTMVNFAATRGSLSSASAATSGGLASVSISSSQAGFSTIVASSSALSKPSTSRTIEFVAVTPAAIELQADPSTVAASQTSELTAIVRDAGNNLVKNAIVEFSLSDSSGGTLSAATAVTSSQGVAKITYTASSQTSATQSVIVTAKVRGTAIQDQAELTVGGRAARIAIGTGSQIIAKDQSTYQLPFTVIVTDSGGNPVSDASFRLSLVSTSYLEGVFGATGPTSGCPNEDVNNNDIKDPGEDSNGNGLLDPGRIASVPATVELDPDDGSGQFLVTYPKDYGLFVKVEITGVATVSGTETTAKREFLLPIAEGDEDNLPGVSPFGEDLNCLTAD